MPQNHKASKPNLPWLAAPWIKSVYTDQVTKAIVDSSTEQNLQAWVEAQSIYQAEVAI